MNWKRFAFLLVLVAISYTLWLSFRRERIDSIVGMTIVLVEGYRSITIGLQKDGQEVVSEMSGSNEPYCCPVIRKISPSDFDEMASSLVAEEDYEPEALRALHGSVGYILRKDGPRRVVSISSSSYKKIQNNFKKGLSEVRDNQDYHLKADLLVRLREKRPSDPYIPLLEDALKELSIRHEKYKK